MTRRKRKILFAVAGGIVAATVVAATWIGIRVFERLFVPYWPPAVSSLEEIETLPPTQRDLRAIAIDDTRLMAIARHLPMLDYLFINSNSQVTDSGIGSLTSLRHLRQLVILNATALTDNAIAVLVGLPSLRELIIERCPHITDASLNALVARGSFSALQLRDCPKLTAEAKQRARTAMPTCRIFFEN
jgi:hypothetical protein